MGPPISYIAGGARSPEKQVNHNEMRDEGDILAILTLILTEFVNYSEFIMFIHYIIMIITDLKVTTTYVAINVPT